MKVTIKVPREIEIDGRFCAESCPQHGGSIDTCCEFKEDDGCSQILDREHAKDGRWVRCDDCLASTTGAECTITKWHELKSYPKFFDRILDGSKPFDVRYNDRNFKVGDGLHLREWDPATKAYSGREMWVGVTYIMGVEEHGGIAEGYVVMGIAPVGIADAAKFWSAKFDVEHAQPPDGEAVDRLARESEVESLRAKLKTVEFERDAARDLHRIDGETAAVWLRDRDLYYNELHDAKVVLREIELLAAGIRKDADYCEGEYNDSAQVKQIQKRTDRILEAVRNLPSRPEHGQADNRDAALIRGIQFVWSAYQSAFADRATLVGTSDADVKERLDCFWRILCSPQIVGFDPLTSEAATAASERTSAVEQAYDALGEAESVLRMLEKIVPTKVIEEWDQTMPPCCWAFSTAETCQRAREAMHPHVDLEARTVEEETYEQRWLRQGYKVEWSDDFEGYSVDRTDGDQVEGKLCPTINDVEIWIAIDLERRSRGLKPQ